MPNEKFKIQNSKLKMSGQAENSTAILHF